MIFQKYSVLEGMGAAVKDMLSALYQIHKMPIIACDKEKVIAAKGITKAEIINRRITSSLTEIMERRIAYTCGTDSNALFFPVEGIERYAVACAPVIASGDVVGAILYISDDNTPLSSAPETQITLVRAFADYLGGQLSD